MTPKFKIGQAVFLKDDVEYYVSLHNQKYDTYGNPRPRSMTVVSIVTEECPGGVQIGYRFSGASPVPINEIALTDTLPNLNKEPVHG